MSGTPTPRTDALLLRVDEGRHYATDGPITTLARQLERDLAAAQENFAMASRVAAEMTAAYAEKAGAAALLKQELNVALAANAILHDEIAALKAENDALLAMLEKTYNYLEYSTANYDSGLEDVRAALERKP